MIILTKWFRGWELRVNGILLFFSFSVMFALLSLAYQSLECAVYLCGRILKKWYTSSALLSKSESLTAEAPDSKKLRKWH